MIPIKHGFIFTFGKDYINDYHNDQVYLVLSLHMVGANKKLLILLKSSKYCLGK